MKPSFALTPQAHVDLAEILLEIAEDSPDAAERLRVEFHEGLQPLGRSQGIGHFHADQFSRRYRFWNFYRYVVAYVCQTKPIQAICVIQCARDPNALFSLHR
ncbi:MAG: type II toxin-antitoxin system RelE/ParE family toxin, partial [Bryobacteraceae bacterium]|nr:type II toxin-antitoxin system RelE/ParE family toxin [Bryobacteraceae bacterium]